ncbi:MAG: D-tyrosyl-tRNA(Tyr) deacylase [Saprospiraceae bacterium]|nr:D-tyrosyl-tRNA(Tyr) deacylase [Saprospiraceae bacterium]
MRAIIQRVKEASVKIDGKVHEQIGSGMMVLLGICKEDQQKDLEWMSRKIVNMRIFGDDDGKINLNIRDTAGEILLISQFTLYASTKKGNRPSFIKAAGPEIAKPLYLEFINTLSEEGIIVRSGIFGADMKVSLINDGPVTIIIDSKTKE